MAKVITAIPYIKKSEGGLSRAKTDSASKNPAPFTYNGFNGWHTNKGVTWTTFVNLASKLGYVANATNFFTMPDNIWIKIYENGYFNPMSADKLKSDVIAAAIADYAWAFGTAGAKSRLLKWLQSEYGFVAGSMDGAVSFINEQNEVQFFKKLIEHRKNAFLKLNQPVYNKGWIARMVDLENFGIELLKKKVKKIKARYHYSPGYAFWGGLSAFKNKPFRF